QAVEGAAPPPRSLADGLPQPERIDPRLDAHREHLGERRLDDIARAIVDELGDRARADGSHVVGLIADGIEHRLVALEDRLLAPATARGVSAHPAPASRWGAAASRRTSWTTSAWPARIRLDAM